MKYNFISFSIMLFVIILASCSHMRFKKLEKINNKYDLSTEPDLMNSVHTNKIDSLYASGTDGYFKGVNNVKIYYNYFLQNRKENGAIVISSGRTEAAVKYKEVIFDLFNNGYSVYIHDHRGQGLSGRMVADHDMGYIDEFGYYINDMKYFYDIFVAPHNHKNIYLLTHSMGGAIGMTYLEQYPDDFDAAAFSSPMLGLVFPSCELVELLEGKTPKYALGQENYEDGLTGFKKNHLTTCKTRYQRMLTIYEEVPEARLGGASYQWVDKSCKQFDIIYDNIANIKTPLILFSAEDDKIVATSAHDHFIKKLNATGKEAGAYSIEDAQHELFIEKDELRIEVLTKVLDFYKKHK